MNTHSNVVEMHSGLLACMTVPGQAEKPVPVGPFEPFVDEHVVARFLQIAPRRVLEMARKGELPSHPIGRTRKTWRFRISEIDQHFSVSKKPSRATLSSAVSGTKERNRLG